MCKLIKSLSQYSFKFVESDEDLPKFPRGFVGITWKRKVYVVGLFERTPEGTKKSQTCFDALWLKDLMDVTEKLQFIDPTFRHLIRGDGEGTRQ